MKTKIFTLFTAVMLCIAACTPALAAFANAQQQDTIVIAADGDFYDYDALDILSTTNLSYGSSWVYTMTYDRLFDLDEYGNLTPELATGWEIVHSSDYSLSEQKHTAISLQETAIQNSVTPLFNSAYEDVLPEEYCSELYNYGWDFPVDFDNEEIYLDGSGTLAIEIALKEDIAFNDDTPFDAYALQSLIEFALTQPEDTVIYRQWSPVYDIIPVENHIVLYLSFINCTFGFEDFMLSLATPAASMVLPYGDYAIGTGAYNLVDCNGAEITLERNSDWWKGETPTQYIKFVNAAPESAERLLKGYSADLAFVPYGNYKNSAGRFNFNAITTAPLTLLLNRNNDFMDGRIFTVLDYAINVRNILNTFDANNTSLYVADRSKDVWIDASRYSYFEAQRLLEDEIIGVICDNLTIEMLAQQAYAPVVDAIRENLDELNVNLNVDFVDDKVFKQEVASDNDYYDVFFGEIDMANVNSVYNTFKDIDDDEMQELLATTKKAANINAYLNSYYKVQKFAYDNSYIEFMGFGTKLLAMQTDVEGFEAPYGFKPLGSMYALDFRYLEIA